MDNLEIIIPAIVSFASVIATVVPKPASNSNIIYKVAYQLLQFVAFNFGRAKNEDNTDNNTGNADNSKSDLQGEKKK